jgi:ribulose-5-phosphate 4-epimerase/fuculose-1-phosphate aldolase
MVTLFVRRVVGSDLKIAVYRAVYTEVNARLQLQAQGLGGPLNFLTPEEGRMADDANRAALAAVAQESAGKVGVRNSTEFPVV